MDDIPLVPACTGLRFLLRGCGAEAKATYLFFRRPLSEQGDDESQQQAEQEHPYAEGIYIQFVEYICEGVVRFGVEDHHDKPDASEHQSCYQGPHSGLRRSLLPRDSQEEYSGDGRSQQALDTLDIVIEGLADGLDDEYP